MSAAKHTPGPWVAAPYEGFGPRTTVRQGDERTGMRIASTFETTSPRNIERNEANALLIAAAPDLLEAVQLYVAWIEAEEDHSKADFYQRLEMCRAADAAARAALAKATGAK